MKYRSVAHIIPADTIDMGGTMVKQTLPTARVAQISPFLLLHHFGPTAVEPGVDPLDVGPHPHRGFEPVTFLYQGGIRHKDSRGNEGILQGGDVQWMTAGMGIIHSERASKSFLENGGTMEGIQLWVNLPADKKMVQPAYQDIKSENIPTIDTSDRKVHLQLVAGAFGGETGPAKTHTPLLALQVTLHKGGKVDLPVSPEFNLLIYVLSGEVKLNDNWSYAGETMLHFKNDGEGIALEGTQDARILVLSGLPIEEPLATYGPFVMNSQTEILEAMRDYQMGKMGVYID